MDTSQINISHFKEAINRELDTVKGFNTIHMSQYMGIVHPPDGFMKHAVHTNQNMTIMIVAPDDMTEDVKVAVQTLAKAFERKYQQ